MLAYPDIDPVALQIGPIRVHWYGVMYLVGFAAGWWLGRLRARDPRTGFAPAEVDDLLFYVALGIILGGRLGYLFFYGLDRLLADPLSALRVWEGGMSFHGGLLGVVVGAWLFARRTSRPFFVVGDFIVPLVPPGLAAGRLGNFINGNLWGAPSDLPWAMVFPDPRAGGVARHPTQLYEALLEGLVLFIVLWIFSRRPRPTMAVSGVFLAGYALARLAVEFVRVPDAHIGYLAGGWLTMGHVLTAPMLLLGVLLVVSAYRWVPGAWLADSEHRPTASPTAARSKSSKRRHGR
jgi:phosphatidylglycerol:prolipoprotein diacylglycerol transferase